MSQSARLRTSDVRFAIQLGAKLAAEAARGVDWRPLAIEGLCEKLGAQSGGVFDYEGFTADGSLNLLDLTTAGFHDPAEIDAVNTYAQWVAAGRGRQADPMLDAASRQRGNLICRRWDHLVEKRDWLRSDVYAVCRLARRDHPMTAWWRRQRNGRTLAVSLNRGLDEANFSDHDHRVLNLFARELRRLYRDGRLAAAPVGDDQPRQAISQLTPRQQQVVVCLLLGDSYKQTALRLGLSRYTVEGYLKDVYRRLGVASRGELMSMFVTIPPELDQARRRLEREPRGRSAWVDRKGAARPS